MSKVVDAIIVYVIHSVPHVLVSVLVSVVGAASYRVRRMRPDWRVLSLPNSLPVVEVFPDRNIATPSGLSERTYVTGEDMGAMDAVSSALIRAGAKPHSITRREASRFGDVPYQGDYQANVVLICSEKGNPVTGEFWDRLRRHGSINVRFERQADDRWCISADGRAPWISPSYEQELTLRSMKKAFQQGPVEDYAVLARLPNPFNPAAKVIIVAGIRGIGTRGAAEFLDKQISTIWKRTKGSDFVLVLKVRYADYQVDGVTVESWDVRD